MRFPVAAALALVLVACAPTAQVPKPTSSVTPSVIPTPTPAPSPATVLDVNYLDQTGSHFSGQVDVSSDVAVQGRLLIELRSRTGQVLGKVCGQTVSLTAGTRQRITFNARGPAILFDRAVPVIGAC